MAGHLKGTPKTGGRRAGTPNKRTVALRTATAAAVEQINAALGPDTFDGDAHALLMTVYKDPNRPIGLRLEAAKAALPYEKPRLSSLETTIVDELEGLSIGELERIARGEDPSVPPSDAPGGIPRCPPRGKPKLVANW